MGRLIGSTSPSTRTARRATMSATVAPRSRAARRNSATSRGRGRYSGGGKTQLEPFFSAASFGMTASHGLIAGLSTPHHERASSPSRFSRPPEPPTGASFDLQQMCLARTAPTWHAQAHTLTPPSSATQAPLTTTCFIRNRDRPDGRQARLDKRAACRQTSTFTVRFRAQARSAGYMEAFIRREASRGVGWGGVVILCFGDGPDTPGSLGMVVRFCFRFHFGCLASEQWAQLASCLPPLLFYQPGWGEWIGGFWEGRGKFGDTGSCRYHFSEPSGREIHEILLASSQA